METTLATLLLILVIHAWLAGNARRLGVLLALLFLARLDTAALGMPLDKNVAFDSMGSAVSVNNMFFEVCEPQGCSSCPVGQADLAGTGFDAGGGATKWLTTEAPIVRGETITLDLSIFDVSDGAMDSAVLLDGFAWISCVFQHECHHDPCPPLICTPN